ncbi:nidogen-like domain-containing protein [Hymenobacter persicinus]|uniref:T9SS type A sorting domain-containing protein n=1 Tax=Hymenobacter persicinus TaxID=2025506 RepID=A0A4Q5LE89_9BACT|nr:nidogen-like domain-containing protein [Hymenobacter persicinus]RYU82456.1 T9SS type A sorting domain-containing protein [Hymenobacter persicinus]
MPNFYSTLLPRFLTTVWLAACTISYTRAQAPSAPPRVHDPALSDPTYAARKRQLSAAHRLAAPTPELLPASTGPLPACFEPLDSVSIPAVGGYTQVPRNDDGSLGPINLGFTFTLFGTPYTSVYINTNGNLTFTSPLQAFSASGFPISTPMVAAFWADVDTNPASSGSIWYKLYENRLVVTWNRVGYYNAATDKKNTFQIVLRANRADIVTDDVSFSYGDMQWTTGSASQGVNGFGGAPATVGANRGNGIDFIQTGRFNLNDASHPDNVNPSGVNWLDGRCVSYRVFAPGNLPPVASNLPANNTIFVNQGETVSIAPQFSGPEVGQTVRLAVNTNGLCNTSYSVTNTVNPTLNLSVTGGACNIGTSTILVTATDDGAPSQTEQFPITVVVNPPAVSSQWTGSVSSVYTAPANWSTSVVPTVSTNVTIPATAVRMPVLSAAASVNSLTIDAGASLTLAGPGTLTVNGTVLTNGPLSGEGMLVTAGSAAQSLGGSSRLTVGTLEVGSAGASLSGPVAVSRLLTLNGNLTTNAQALTLLSDATGSAMVVNNGAAAVTGNATVQRYINPANPGLGYRHYAAPVRNTTLGDLATTGFAPVLNPAYNSAITPGAVLPYPTVFGFNESRIGGARSSFDQGWFSPAATTETMAPGVGYTVNLGAAALVDFVGPLTTGPIARTGLTRGPEAASGWHLLGNPYPAPIDWTVAAAGLSGLDNAVYVYKSSGPYEGSYGSFVNGVGDARYLAVGQGFFVRTTTAGVAGSLSFTNAARLTSYLNPDFSRPATVETRPLLQLDLVQGTQRDAATVYFEKGATAAFDPAFDAYKLSGPVAGLALPADAETLSISGLPALTGADVTVPVRVWATVAGTYSLEAARLLNLPAGMRAYLQDTQTGTVTDLTQQPTYRFSLSAGFDGPRFRVLFSTRQVTSAAPGALGPQVQLYPNPAHDQALLLLPISLAQHPVTATLLNSLGQTVRTYSLAAPGSGQHALSLSGLARGVYSVQLSTAQGQIVKRLIIE